MVMPVSGAQSWTVLDDSLQVVAPAERYLAHLAAIERSPNTVRAYAHSLSLWLGFLDRSGVAWSAAQVEDVSRFVGWLRRPADNVIVIDAGTARRSASSTGLPGVRWYSSTSLAFSLLMMATSCFPS